MLEPDNRQVYNPCCGSSDIFESVELIQAHTTGMAGFGTGQRLRVIESVG